MKQWDGTLKGLSGSKRSTNYDEWERWVFGPAAPRQVAQIGCKWCNIVYICVVFTLVVIGLRTFA